MTGTLTDALLAVHDVLADEDIPHALCGGVAANLYRKDVRATMDVDLAIAVGPARLVDLTRTFSSRGWQAEPFWRRGEQMRLMHDDLPRVDFIVATTDYERNAIDRSVPMKIGGRAIQVLAAEDLIVFKLIAGRARDYEAVAAIVNFRGGDLDTGYITGWLEQFGEPKAWKRALAEAQLEADE